MSAGSDQKEATMEGVSRRTVTTAAAWSIPVVAAAVAVPLASASVTVPTLSFTQQPGLITACSTTTTALLQLTTNGTTPAPAGSPVTVTLPAGLKWGDGGTGARTLLTDASGRVQLSGANALAAGAASGTYAISATAPGVTSAAVAQAVVNLNQASWYTQPGGGSTLYPVSGAYGDIVQVAEIGVGTAFGRNSAGEIWVTSPNPTNPSATKITGITAPAVDVAGWYGGSYGLAAAGGTVFTIINGQAYPSGIPASANIVQVSVGTAAALARGADGRVYRYDPSAAASTTPPVSQMTGLPAGGATDIDTFGGAGTWAVAVGADGKAYGSVPSAPDTFKPIAGAYGTATKVTVSAGETTILTSTGEIWQVEPNTAVINGTPATRVGTLSGITSFDTYESGGAYLVAISNGIGYLFYPGATNWVPIGGATNLTKIVVGAGYVTALGADGIVYQSVFTAANPTFTPLAGASNAIDLQKFLGAGAFLSVAATRGC